MTYEVVSTLVISCDGPACPANDGDGAHIELGVDEVVNSETIEEVVRRALVQLPNSDWLALLDFNATSRTALTFYCSTTCLSRGADVPPPTPSQTVYDLSRNVPGVFQTSAATAAGGAQAHTCG